MGRWSAMAAGLVLLGACGSDSTDAPAEGPAGDGPTDQVTDPGMPGDMGGDGTPSTPGEPAPGGVDTPGAPVPDAPPITQPTALVQGCEGQTLREIPADLEAPGPWPVGAITTTLGDVRAEVFYPGAPGSEASAPQVIYDIRDHIPAGDREKVREEENPWQPCNCFRELPVDAEAGPYPLVVFVHGTAGFRTQNLENVVHWASRGFIVISADHPGIWFADLVGGFGLGGGADQTGDARRMLADMADLSDNADLAFLDGFVDTTRQGASGHSAGGGAIMGLAGEVDVLMPLAGAGSGGASVSQTYLVGDVDGAAGGTRNGYAGAPATKRLGVVRAGGHLVGSSLCNLRDPRDPSRDLLDIIADRGIGGFLGQFAGGLFQGCNDSGPDIEEEFIAADRGIAIFNYITAGTLEEELHCSPTAAAELSRAPEIYGADLVDYQEEL